MMLDREVLACGLGMAIVLLGLAIAFLCQKRLFAKYRGRIRNASEGDEPRP